ncbi:MAG: CHASE4 domain-containing protein [bacterium]
MRLKTRIALVLVATLALLLTSFFLIFSRSTLKQIEKVEIDGTKKELTFSLRNMQKELKNLDAFLGDWSEWDETYNFAQSKIPRIDFIRKNMPPESVLKQRNNLWAFLDNNRNIIYAIEVDHKRKLVSPISRELIDFFNTKDIPRESSGIVVIKNKVYLLACSPILDSSGKKPSAGTMVMGIEWDRTMIETVYPEEVTFHLDILDNSNQVNNGDIQVNDVSKDKIISSIILKDIFGKPAVKLQADTIRLSNLYARKQLSYLLFYIILGYVFASAAIILLSNKIFILQHKIYQSGKLASLGTIGDGIAHELNNPVTIIDGFTQSLETALQEKKSLTKEIKEYLNSIKTNLLRIRKIVDNIKTFSRSSMDLKSLELKDVNNIVSESIMLFEQQLQNDNIKLELVLHQDLPKTLVDAAKLRVAIHNLITNAREELVEHRENKKKKIKISTNPSTDKSTIIIYVEDNGRGVSPEHINRIFDPFYTTKEPGRGTGFGLPLVHGIMRDFKGNVELSSDKNKNTIFKLTLPVTKEIDC